MSALAVYAIVADELAAPPEFVQVAGGGVVAVALRVQEPTGPSAAAALAHAAVVKRLAELADPILPARLGEVYDSRERLVAALEEQGPALRRALERARGCVELGVRGRAEAAKGRAGSGREYLERRRADEARRAALHEPLRRLSAAARLEPAHDGFAGSYLVPRERVAAFVAEVERLATSAPESELACSGPWPAYSFAGGGT